MESHSNFSVPNSKFRKQLNQKIFSISDYTTGEQQDILRRVTYYHNINQSKTYPISIPKEACRLKDLSMTKKSFYYYDFRSILRHFPSSDLTAQRFGDIRTVSDYPSIVKTRPIDEPNENSIILRMESLRHFMPIKSGCDVGRSPGDAQQDRAHSPASYRRCVGSAQEDKTLSGFELKGKGY